MSAPRSRPRSFWRDTHGSAAVEFVLWLGVLTLPMMNAVDLGMYVFQKMQVQIAAQSAAQGVWRLCDKPTKLPAVQNCDDLAATIQTGAQSTSLGPLVTVAAGAPVEGYYCVNSAGALQLVGAAGSPGSPPTKPSPFNCSSVISGSTTKPGDYVQVTVSYAYAPVFSRVSMASLLTTPITRTAWMRLS